MKYEKCPYCHTTRKVFDEEKTKMWEAMRKATDQSIRNLNTGTAKYRLQPRLIIDEEDFNKYREEGYKLALAKKIWFESKVWHEDWKDYL